MAKKLTDAADDDSQLAHAVRLSAQQIWQAGLGAFAKAQQGGGRVFDKLVQEGSELQKRTRSLAEEHAPGLSDKVAKVADGVGRQAAGSWDKLEQVFEDRVARALATIGVPTRKDIDALTRQVEALSLTVAKLSGQPKGAARKPARKAAVKTVARSVAKPAAKAVARKAAPKKSRPAPA
jgi:poly(hydroxyalkanoate) granule-associated protein